MATSFIPRVVFPRLESLPRSYFLGHHRSGLKEMRKVLTSIDLIIECRDYRVPISSRNPLLEESVAGKHRLILYTKHDLGSSGSSEDKRRENIIRKWHSPTPVIFSDFRSTKSVQYVLDFAKTEAEAMDNLTGARLMVIGMPNVGKSSLLNALRSLGIGKGKAAQTGDQPGVTRKIGNEVRIAGDPKAGDSLYLVDTPGVFVPYMTDPEDMLKLSLCGSVKDSVISPIILADYLLFRVNLVNPSLYSHYCEPTNDVDYFLEAAAKKTGRLQKGGIPEVESTANWLIQRWRTGHLGKFVLDTVNEASLQEKIDEETKSLGSITSARNRARVAKKTMNFTMKR